MKKVKLKPVHQSFGCELDNFLIPVKQQRILLKLGIGTRILSVPRRKKGLTSSGEPQKCHYNTSLLTETFGGQHLKGFFVCHSDLTGRTHLIWHSVWVTPEGKAVDVTLRENIGNSLDLSDFTPFIPVHMVNEKSFLHVNHIIIPDNPIKKPLLVKHFSGLPWKEIPIGQVNMKNIFKVETTISGVQSENNWMKMGGTSFLQPSTATGKYLSRVDLQKLRM